ncbi:Mu transposase domain-containing protein [Cognatiyoonia sp. IB215182]|uniref:Mu transposase domain-containing protein n=1 Tax=Cognatiyoonia sp. IB215182 TaxID=3097353 RepID=UPI002A1810FE|nr:hypothetical protein [Cognatiyoonia sp. IB215182]MDX8355669.1 hypothetical protein [Cognatiyoonia sp. IB215182]
MFELNDRGVPGKVLYREYLEAAPKEARTISLTTFYRAIEEHADKKQLTITFEYEAGEMIQIDFVGRKRSKQPVLLDIKGMELDYEILGAVSVKSRKTFALAIESQAKLPVLTAMIAMFEFFGGVPVLLTIDNFAAAVAKPRRGRDEAILTPEFQELADHYEVGLKAARVRRPKDKALVENGVGILQNDVLAPLRNRRFFSLSEMNAAISERLTLLNDRPFCSQTGESRNQLFIRTDAPGYRSLPKTPYEPGKWILKLRVGKDYHVRVEGCRYSLPHRLANELVGVKLTATSIHLAHAGKVVATHIRSREPGKVVTNPDHMPPEHQQASMMRLSGMKAYVRDIGTNAERLIDEHFRITKKPDETAKNAMKLRALTDQYSADRIDLACARAITVGKRTAATVERILASGLDRLDEGPTEQPDAPNATSNIRGASYFATLLNGCKDGRDV